MKKIYITFGGQAYDAATEKIIADAKRYGADEVRVYDDWWIMNKQKDFYDRNRWAFEHHHKRGFGWYIWKPFIILHALEHADEGDVILYTDADTYPVADLNVLYDTCKKDGGAMFFSAAGLNNRQWCKRDCFIVMNQDEPKYHDAPAGVARFMLFQKGPWKPHQFLMEWITYCTNEKANTFEKSVLGPELEGFTEHRAEQAIMTNLIHKYGYKLYREACQAGERFTDDKDLYPTLFHQEGAVAGNYLNKTAPALGSKFRNVD